MLSAEHLALQSRLVQQLAEVRQREMDYVLTRYQAIGTQAALVAGFSMQTLVSLDVSSTPQYIIYIFFLASLACVLSCMHVVIVTLYVSNWAPGLALRGPTGSLSKAFDATIAERNQINGFFCVALLSFITQTVVAVMIVDGFEQWRGETLLSAGVAGGATAASVFYLHRMRRRFFGSDAPQPSFDDERGNLLLQHDGMAGGAGEANAAAASPTKPAEEGSKSEGGKPSKAAGRANKGGSADGHTFSLRQPQQLLDNPVAAVASHPDIITGASKASQVVRARRPTSEFEMRGVLHKRSLKGSEAEKRAAKSDEAEGRRTSIKKQLSAAAASVALSREWQPRFFVLRAGKLQYWASESDFDSGQPGRLAHPVELRGYEVLVDMACPNWGFELRPTLSDGRRTWCFRAPSESDRLEWSRRLVASTLVSAGL